MTNEEAKRTIELIKKSREQIGDKYDGLAQKVNDDLKEILTDEQYRVWTAANGSEEEEKKLISEIGEEKYSELLTEITKKLSEKLN